jgi:polysaccharide export outer membrane protein
MHVGKALLAVSLTFTSMTLGGCGTMSASGPASTDIWNRQSEASQVPYVLVPVTSGVTSILGKYAPRLLAFANQRRPADIRFGIGDIVSVTIFESAAGGLFIPSEAGVRPGNFITIPNQAVDVRGNISIPYAGVVRASGRTQTELQDVIVNNLKPRAIEPQVIVSTADQRSSLVTVITDSTNTKATRVPALMSPERLLDTIARAGGPGGPGPDTWVILERQGKRAVAPFGALVQEPVNNVYTHPNDTIYLYREPQTFLAFGAFGNQHQVPFGTWRLSLAEAISKAGGLVDSQADPAAVFLYRTEAREIAESLGVDCSPFEGSAIPIIYQINLRDPGGYFLASKLEMRNKDIIYVANSFSVESSKFLNYIATVNNTVQGVITTTTSAYGLRNIIRGTGSIPGVLTVNSGA